MDRESGGHGHTRSLQLMPLHPSDRQGDTECLSATAWELVILGSECLSSAEDFSFIHGDEVSAGTHPLRIPCVRSQFADLVGAKTVQRVDSARLWGARNVHL